MRRCLCEIEPPVRSTLNFHETTPGILKPNSLALNRASSLITFPRNAGYFLLGYARTKNTSHVREARQVSIAFARAMSIRDFELLFHATLRHNRVWTLSPRLRIARRVPERDTLKSGMAVAHIAICCIAVLDDHDQKRESGKRGVHMREWVSQSQRIQRVQSPESGKIFRGRTVRRSASPTPAQWISSDRALFLRSGGA